jgi:hypothetical protein
LLKHNLNIPKKETTEFYDKLSTFTHGENWAIETLVTKFWVSEEGEPMLHFDNPSPYDKTMIDPIAGFPLQTLLVIQALFPEISDYDKRQIAETQRKQYQTWKKQNQ